MPAMPKEAPMTPNTPAAAAPTRWPAPIRWLHWLMAGLLIVQWASGEWDDWLGEPMHFSLGLVVLLLAVVRLGLRFTTKAPHGAGAPTLPDRIAQGVHVLFYGVMVALPISGLLWRQARGKEVWFFDLFRVPSFIDADKAFAGTMHETHEVLATLFLVLFGLHVLGALKRQFLDRQDILARMR
jgi:cytochrome b561